jgi:hypothetical protein
VHWGSAGAEHPEGGLLDGFCLNKQAPRQKKQKTYQFFAIKVRVSKKGGATDPPCRVLTSFFDPSPS